MWVLQWYELDDVFRALLGTNNTSGGHSGIGESGYGRILFIVIVIFSATMMN